MKTPTAERPDRTSSERRPRIVAAARHLFLRQGFRATTMEAVAREAGVAKPTLYGYFPDKGAVFAAVVEEFTTVMLDRVEGALSGDGDAVQRIAAAISAKYKVVVRLLEGSPYADELYGEHQRSSAATFQRIEQSIEAAVVRELATAGLARPRLTAQLFLAAAYGVSRRATAVAEIGPAIRVLAERLLRPEVDAARRDAETREPAGPPVR